MASTGSAIQSDFPVRHTGAAPTRLSPDGTDAYAVLEEADQAMYAAKTARSTGVATMAALSP